MDIMCGNKSLATSRKENDVLVFELAPGVPNWVVPKDLFIGGKTKVTMQEVIAWAKRRVFPKDRVGAKELLAEIGLKSYDAWTIAKIERASQVTDSYWLKLDPKDTYEAKCARGRLGMPAMTW